MKSINITYWITTALFSVFMIASGIPNLLSHPDSVAFLSTQLGYPEYIIPFLGFAKIVGSLTLLVPGVPRLKEWAYAGLFYDLLGAAYSVVALEGFQVSMLLMPVVMLVEAVSYWCHHERLKAAKA
jgi:hypothetical protein